MSLPEGAPRPVLRVGRHPITRRHGWVCEGDGVCDWGHTKLVAWICWSSRWQVRQARASMARRPVSDSKAWRGS
jgi:hypothetical protein